MIHIAIGTKAQLIKMSPVLRGLKARNIEFNFIDLGQHSVITANLRDEFGLKDPDVRLSFGENISGLFQGIVWALKLFCKGLNARWVREKIFQNKSGVCLIHGDTVSTFLALYFAKRARIKVAHVEAGLRSDNYFEPFPEELLRVAAMHFSDILFAPSVWAVENIHKMGLKKETVLLSGNTSLETTYHSLKKSTPLNLNVARYALVTVHRMENIFSKKRLNSVVDFIARTSPDLPVVFVQHPPTIGQLKKFNLESRLKKINNVYFFQILSHAHFIHLLRGCEFVVTDGGSIQEESFYLGKPCLLLRRNTERREGLGENVVLSDLREERMDDFLRNYKNFIRAEVIDERIKPSEEIINYIVSRYLP